jgi:hypothetical protein
MKPAGKPSEGQSVLKLHQYGNSPTIPTPAKFYGPAGFDLSNIAQRSLSGGSQILWKTRHWEQIAIARFWLVAC